MESATTKIITANYGSMKLARYLVRSYDDLVDVCQTISRQVLYCVERDQVFNVFNAIDCRCTCVPNTLSSIILGFTVPEKILQKRDYRSRPTLAPELRVPATQAPKYEIGDGYTLFQTKVNCFFDLYLLHRFIREAMNLSGEGMKLITSKRMAQLKLSEPNSDGFGLRIAFPVKCDMEPLIQLEGRFLRQALTGS